MLKVPQSQWEVALEALVETAVLVAASEGELDDLERKSLGAAARTALELRLGARLLA